VNIGDEPLSMPAGLIHAGDPNHEDPMKLGCFTNSRSEPSFLGLPRSSFCRRFPPGFFLCFDFDPLAFDVETDPTKDAHIHISYPYKREARDEITAPIVEEKFVSRDDEKESCS
jgi:hypothetical protein